MTQIPNAQAVLNALGEKGWDLRGYCRVGEAEMIGRLPVDERLLLVGQMYAITPRVDNSANVPAVIARQDYLRSEGLGSRLHLRDEEFKTSIIQMYPLVAVFLPLSEEAGQPIGIRYTDLERRITKNFGPNLRTNQIV